MHYEEIMFLPPPLKKNPFKRELSSTVRRKTKERREREIKTNQNPQKMLRGARNKRRK